LGRTHEAERGIEESLAMSDSFGDLSFPVMAAAGAAVHLGLGDRALTISQHALDRTMAMGADGSESRITAALALCQVGRADDALVALDEVDHVTPYLCAVRALARAMTGDPSGAVEDAERVDSDPGSSYLDRVIAGTAGAAAMMQRGLREVAVECFDRAGAVAHDAGDVVARDLVALTRSLVLSEDRHQEVSHLGSGWKLVAAFLAALVLDVSGEPV
jgi:hypothetical protein